MTTGTKKKKSASSSPVSLGKWEKIGKGGKKEGQVEVFGTVYDSDLAFAGLTAAKGGGIVEITRKGRKIYQAKDDTSSTGKRYELLFRSTTPARKVGKKTIIEYEHVQVYVPTWFKTYQFLKWAGNLKKRPLFVVLPTGTRTRLYRDRNNIEKG